MFTAVCTTPRLGNLLQYGPPMPTLTEHNASFWKMNESTVLFFFFSLMQCSMLSNVRNKKVISRVWVKFNMQDGYVFISAIS